MKYIKTYNEGLLDKATELLNYSKKADEISKKYIKMIYDDWNKNKDLFRVTILEKPGYYKMEYVITDGESTNAQYANRDENSITIRIEYSDKIVKWRYSNKTRARIDADIFKQYLGNLNILGTDRKTGEIYDNIAGTKEDISYLDIPSKEAKKLIEFFIKEFKSKYPSMSGKYGSNQMMDLDPDLRTQWIQRDKDIRTRLAKEHTEERERESNKVIDQTNILELKEEIQDYFFDIESEHVDIKIAQSLFDGSSLFWTYKRDSEEKETVNKIFSLDSKLNLNKLGYKRDDITLEENVPYYMILISLYDEERDKEEFKTSVENIIKRWTGEDRELELGASLFQKFTYEEEGGELFEDTPENKEKRRRAFLHTILDLTRSAPFMDRSSTKYLIFLKETI